MAKLSGNLNGLNRLLNGHGYCLGPKASVICILGHGQKMLRTFEIYG
jgi:hypothetical protein